MDGLDQRSISVSVVVTRSDTTSQHLDWNSRTDRAYKQGMLCKQKSDLTAHASYRSTFLVVRNANHCLQLLAFGIFMTRP